MEHLYKYMQCPLIIAIVINMHAHGIYADFTFYIQFAKFINKLQNGTSFTISALEMQHEKNTSMLHTCIHTLTTLQADCNNTIVNRIHRDKERLTRDRDFKFHERKRFIGSFFSLWHKWLPIHLCLRLLAIPVGQTVHHYKSC